MPLWLNDLIDYIHSIILIEILLRLQGVYSSIYFLEKKYFLKSIYMEIKELDISPSGKSGIEFDQIIKKTPAFVKIHSHTCPHCIEMEPAWEDLIKQVKVEFNGEIALVSVDARTLKDIKSEALQNISGFPTLMEVKKGGVPGQVYTGDRSSEAMLDFLRKIGNISPKAIKAKGGGKKTKRRRKVGQRSRRKKTYRRRRSRRHRRKPGCLIS